MGGKRGGRGGRGDREGGDRREDQYGEVGGSQDRQAFSGFNSGKGHTGGGSAGASAKGDFTFIRQVPKFLQRYTHLMGPAAADEDDPVIVGGPEGGRKGGKGGRGGEEGEEEEEEEPEENLEADALRRAMAENPELAKEFEGTLASKLKQAEAAEEKEKGNALFGKKKFEEAAKSFGRCIELDPSNEVYWSNRSASFASLERWEEAAADARRCVALKPGWAKGWARLGAACMGLKLYGDSREAYEKALRIEPDDQQLRRLAEKAESMELQQAQQGKHTFKKMRTGGGGGGGGTGGGRGGAGGGGGGAGAGGGSAPGPGASEAECKGGAGGSGGAGAAGAAAVPTAAPRPGANKRVLSFADEEEEG